MSCTSTAIAVAIILISHHKFKMSDQSQLKDSKHTGLTDEEVQEGHNFMQHAEAEPKVSP
jgi:hypothetical protein